MRALALVLCLAGCVARPQAPPLTPEQQRPKVIVGDQGEMSLCGPAEWVLEEQWYLDRSCEPVSWTRRHKLICSRPEIENIRDDDPALPLFRDRGESLEDAKVVLAVERANVSD